MNLLEGGWPTRVIAHDCMELTVQPAHDVCARHVIMMSEPYFLHVVEWYL